VGSDSVSAAEVIGRFAACMLVWAVALMAASLAFTAAWNGCLPSMFGMQTIKPLESLCLLSCVWILSRLAVPRFVMEAK
jgi:hypothetical protein